VNSYALRTDRIQPSCCSDCLQGLMPDIVTMAKGIGNGLPLAAVVTTPQIAEVRCRARVRCQTWHHAHVLVRML